MNPAPVLLRLSAGIAMAGIGLLFVMVVAFALPVIGGGGSGGGPFSWTWQPGHGQFGVLPMLCGSLLLSASALLLGWPLALAVCAWTLCTGQGRMRQLVRGTIRLMTAIPTVVYGFAAVFLLTPLVREGLGGAGLCWLSAGLMLTVLVLPTMVLVLETGLRPRLEALCPGGLAVGFSRMELLALFVLPGARSTLVTGAVIGFGRAVGDTLIPLMLAGNAPQLPAHLAEGLRTLTSHMALVTSNEVGGQAYDSLFLAGMLLLTINAAVSLCLRRLGVSGLRDFDSKCSRDFDSKCSRTRDGRA